MDRGWGGVQWDRGVDGRGRGMERVEGKRIGVGGNPKCRVVGYVGGGEQGRLAWVERGECRVESLDKSTYRCIAFALA